MRLPKKLLYYMQDLAIHTFFYSPCIYSINCYICIFISGSEGEKASRTRKASILQFTHKYKVAATHLPVALP